MMGLDQLRLYPEVFAVATALFSLLGLCVGSFLALVADRVPRGQSIVRPASHCPTCAHPLGAHDLLPVLSFVALRGKCRYCGTKLSVAEPLAELATGALFAICFVVFYGSASLLVALLVCSMAVACVLVDIRHMLVLDRVLLLCGGAGLLLNLLGHGLCTPTQALLGLAAGAMPLLLVGLAAYGLTRKWSMGGGDIKFMAAIGAMLGWQNALLTLLFASVGGGLALLPLLLCGKVRRGVALPFVPMLAGGAVLALFFGKPLLAWYLSLFAY